MDLSSAELWDLAARLSGVALVVASAEILFALPDVSSWQAGAERRMGVSRVLVVALLVLGVGFVVWPNLTVAGGGIVAAALLLHLVVRFEPMGDGADMLLLLLLVGLGARGLASEPWLRGAVDLCLVTNVCLAYWWSGYAKLRSPAWRGGRQLALAVNSPRYGSPTFAWQLLDHPRLTQAVAWTVISIEVACPLFMALGTPWLLGWAVAAAGLHVGVAYVMGLGRFLWVFGAGLLCLLAARAAP